MPKGIARQAKNDEEEITQEELERALNELESLAGVTAPDESDFEDDDDEEGDVDLVASDDDSDSDVEYEASADDDDSDADEDDDDEEEEPVRKSLSALEKARRKRKAKVVEDDDDEDDEGDEDMGKSVTEDLYNDESLSKAIEVSPFLESLVERSADALETLERSIREDREDSAQMMKSFAKAFRAIGDAMTKFDERLGNIETQPAGKPKGRVEVMERSMGGGNASGNGKEPLQLTKSAVSDALESLAMEGKIKDYDVVRFESSNQMSDNVRFALSEYLKNKGVLVPGQSTQIQ